MEFHLGDIDIKDLRLNYDDGYLGISTFLNVGRLQVEMQEFGLDSMQFAAGDALIENTGFRYAQTKPAPPSQGDTVPLPQFSISNLEVRNVAGIYESVPDGILADVDIQDLLLELPQADLEGTTLVVDRLELSNSRIDLHTTTMEQAAQDTTTVAQNGQGFQWPEWRVRTSNVLLENMNFQLRVCLLYTSPSPRDS